MRQHSDRSSIATIRWLSSVYAERQIYVFEMGHSDYSQVDLRMYLMVLFDYLQVIIWTINIAVHGINKTWLIKLKMCKIYVLVKLNNVRAFVYFVY